MSQKPINMTFYHMDNCGHCVRFEDTWKSLKELNQSNIGFNDINSNDMNPSTKVAGNPVLGFPTIAIDVLGKEYDYSGERSQTAILGFIRDRLRNRVDGVETELSDSSAQVGGDSEPGAAADVEETDVEETDAEKAVPEDAPEATPEEDGTEKPEDEEAEDVEDAEDVETAEVAVVAGPTEADTSPKRNNIFSADEGEPVEPPQGGGMSELDRLLVQEISTMTDHPLYNL